MPDKVPIPSPVNFLKQRKQTKKARGEMNGKGNLFRSRRRVGERRIRSRSRSRNRVGIQADSDKKQQYTGLPSEEHTREKHPYPPYASNMMIQGGSKRKKRKNTKRKRRKNTKRGGMMKYSPSVFSPPRRKTPKKKHPALERSSEKSLPKGSHDGQLVYFNE